MNGRDVWAPPPFERADGDVFATLDDLARSLVNAVAPRSRRRSTTLPDRSGARADVSQGPRPATKASTGPARSKPPRSSSRSSPAIPGMRPQSRRGRARSATSGASSPEFDAGAVSPRLEEAALEAIRLDPLLADAQAALGQLHVRDRQWASAEAAFQQALEIDPSQGSLYVDYAVALLSAAWTCGRRSGRAGQSACRRAAVARRPAIPGAHANRSGSLR